MTDNDFNWKPLQSAFKLIIDPVAHAAQLSKKKRSSLYRLKKSDQLELFPHHTQKDNTEETS